MTFGSIERPRSEFLFPPGQDPSSFTRDNYLPRGKLIQMAEEPFQDLAVQFESEGEYRFFKVKVGGCVTHPRFNDMIDCTWIMDYTLEEHPDIEAGLGRVVELEPRSCNKIKLYKGSWTMTDNGVWVFEPLSLEAETVIMLDPEFILFPYVAHIFWVTEPGKPDRRVNPGADRKAIKNYFDKTEEIQIWLDGIVPLYQANPSDFSWNVSLAAQRIDDLFAQCHIGLRLVEVREHIEPMAEMERLLFSPLGEEEGHVCNSSATAFGSLALRYQDDYEPVYHLYFIEGLIKSGDSWVKGAACMNWYQANALVNENTLGHQRTIIAHEIGHAVSDWGHAKSYELDQLMCPIAADGTIITPDFCCAARSLYNDLGAFGYRPDDLVSRHRYPWRQINPLLPLGYDPDIYVNPDPVYEACKLRSLIDDLPWQGLHPQTAPDPGNPGLWDSDGDGIPDKCDNCPDHPNPDQKRCSGVEQGMVCDADPDDDCRFGSEDNCPDVSNADQADCDGDGVGDACDPSLCAYLPWTSKLRECQSGEGDVLWCRDTGEHQVFYRLTGWTPEFQGGKDKGYQRVENIEARYCSCKDENGTIYEEGACKAVSCRQDGVVNGDIDIDTGWLTANWRARSELLDAELSCTLTDADNNGNANECLEPIPDRIYHRLYHDDKGDTGLGELPGGFNIYWSGRRTGSFYWKWEQEEWPHPQGTNWSWGQGNRIAYPMLWLHPQDPELPMSEGNAYSKRLRLDKDRFQVGPYLSNEHIEVGQILRPQPYKIAAGEHVLVLHGLSSTRNPEEIAPYLYPDPSSSSALLGMQAAEYDPVSGYFNRVFSAGAQEGSAPLDLVDSALCSVSARNAAYKQSQGGQQEPMAPSFRIFAFGGRDQRDRPSGSLWQGEVQEQDAYPGRRLVWRSPSIDGERPEARYESCLFWSPLQKKLLVMGGQGRRHALDDSFLIDPDKLSSERVFLSGDRLGPRAGFGAASDGNRAVLYGGRDSRGRALSGLFGIDLDGLRLAELDWPSKINPGPREGAALELLVDKQKILLFGGKDSKGKLRTDLWEFDLRTAQWQRLRDDCTEGCCPPGMMHASIISSPVDGTLRVFTGKQERSSAEDPVWSLGPNGWISYSELTGQGKPASCYEKPPEQGGCSGCRASSAETDGALAILILVILAGLVRRRGKGGCR